MKVQIELTVNKDIDKHAKQAADKYFSKKASTSATTKASSYENIDARSIDTSKPRKSWCRVCLYPTVE